MIWTGSKQELLDFMSDLNMKNSPIKFELKYSQTKIEFLDVLVYKDHNNMLQTTVYREQITLMLDQITRNCWKIAYHAGKVYG